jgi:hypothetical protein
LKKLLFNKTHKDPMREMERRLEEEMVALKKELLAWDNPNQRAGTPSLTAQPTEAPVEKPPVAPSSEEWDLDPESLPASADEALKSDDLEPLEAPEPRMAKLKALWKQLKETCAKRWGRLRRRAPVWIRRGVREAQASILDPSAETFQSKHAPPLLRNERRRARNRFLGLAALFAVVIFVILKKVYSDY